MRNVFLQAAVFTCAQSQICSSSIREHITAPTDISIASAQGCLCKPYFRAFPQEKLSRDNILTIIIHHIEKAIAEAGWSKTHHGQRGIFLGSTADLLSDYERQLQASPDIVQTLNQLDYQLTDIIESLQNHYPGYSILSFNSACTSGAQAMAYARQWIMMDWLDECIVVGFECFNELTLAHFAAMGLLGSGHLSPFSMQPCGMQLGEGIAALALSSKPSPCCMRTATSQTDTVNITQTSHPAICQLMHDMLATLRPQFPLQAIKTHGIGILLTDSDEAKIMNEMCANTPAFSLKPLLGHTLGACAVLETAVLFGCLKQGHLPTYLQSNVSASNPTSLSINTPAENAMQLLPGSYLLNFFGFGGQCFGFVLEWQG
ncbi:beta-ketoacyl synthase N-terminal-like domain-containing protein [Snodgrassella sp. CFCC 13594]|uniref:beta-ketoacyl synthase N-terminal-like domain-containing protein n=1 Tax=Snodgrassella sp. CFCC 13594 TaxID=1775559 RepID=UPI00083232A1|nr:beta-ketoacyl synthase N-terminal-like domain-containing protein [Snodgrassella sp. CFCC 13594]